VALIDLIYELRSSGISWQIRDGSLVVRPLVRLTIEISNRIRESRDDLLRVLPPSYPAPDADLPDLEDWLRAELRRWDGEVDDVTWRLWKDAEAAYLELVDAERGSEAELVDVIRSTADLLQDIPF
jgi:hypothetical protein